MAFLDLFLLATLMSSSVFLLPPLPRGAMNEAGGMFIKTDIVGAPNPKIGLGPAL